MPKGESQSDAPIIKLGPQKWSNQVPFIPFSQRNTKFVIN